MQGMVQGDDAQVTHYFQVSPDQAHPAEPVQFLLWHIPSPGNPFFTGREAILTRLRTKLETGEVWR